MDASSGGTERPDDPGKWGGTIDLVMLTSPFWLLAILVVVGVVR